MSKMLLHLKGKFSRKRIKIKKNEYPLVKIFTIILELNNNPFDSLTKTIFFLRLKTQHVSKSLSQANQAKQTNN